MALRKDLITIADKNKQKLEQELAAMGDSNVKKSILTKGVAQTAGGLYGLVGVAFVYWIDYLRATTVLAVEEKKNNRAEDKKIITAKIRETVIPYWPLSLVHEAMNIASSAGNWAIGVKEPSNLFRSQSWWDRGPSVIGGFPSLFLAAITGVSCFQIKYGWDNMKKGANYKAHLNQRIKNLDEVSTYIQAQDVLK